MIDTYLYLHNPRPLHSTNLNFKYLELINILLGSLKFKLHILMQFSEKHSASEYKIKNICTQN